MAAFNTPSISEFQIIILPENNISCGQIRQVQRFHFRGFLQEGDNLLIKHWILEETLMSSF